MSHPTSTSFSTSKKSVSPNNNLTGSSGNHTTNHKSCQNKRKYKIKKPKDMPKRPLSAYNIFFKQERQKILASIILHNCDDNEPGSAASTDHSSLIRCEQCLEAESVDTKDNPKKTHANKKRPLPHGKISFENLAKEIGKRWKNLDEDEMNKFKIQAEEDMCRYKRQMDKYHDDQVKKQIRAEELVARQKLQLEARRIQNAQNLEHEIQITRLQLALKQLQQDRCDALGQMLPSSSFCIDRGVINNCVNLNTSEMNLSSILLNTLNPLSSLEIPVVSPFCNMTLPSNMNLFGHAQSTANLFIINPSIVSRGPTRPQSELNHDFVRSEENKNDHSSFLNELSRFKY